MTLVGEILFKGCARFKVKGSNGSYESKLIETE